MKGINAKKQTNTETVASFLFHSSYFLAILEGCKVSISDYLGDGYCDDSANLEACGYDNGDCCDKAASTCKSEAYILKIHTYFFANLSDYFLTLIEPCFLVH